MLVHYCNRLLLTLSLCCNTSLFTAYLNRVNRIFRSFKQYILCTESKPLWARQNYSECNGRIIYSLDGVSTGAHFLRAFRGRAFIPLIWILNWGPCSHCSPSPPPLSHPASGPPVSRENTIKQLFWQRTARRVWHTTSLWVRILIWATPDSSVLAYEYKST